MKLTNEQKQANLEARREARKQAKTERRIKAEKAQKPVKYLDISIEWYRSRTWGNNPRAEARVTFQDGSFEFRDGYTASGCGYDKESTVIAEIFNDFLKYKLWEFKPEQFNHGSNSDKEIATLPYGMANYSGDNPHYSGGVGTSCYYRIAEAIGGKFENVASGKTYDAYRYTENA